MTHARADQWEESPFLRPLTVLTTQWAGQSQEHSAPMATGPAHALHLLPHTAGVCFVSGGLRVFGCMSLHVCVPAFVLVHACVCRVEAGYLDHIILTSPIATPSHFLQ